MDPVTTFPDAMAAIDRFLVHHVRDLDPALIDALLAESAKVSPVDKVVGFARVLEQNGATLPADGTELAAVLGAFVAANGWHAVAPPPAAVPSSPFPPGYMPARPPDLAQ